MNEKSFISCSLSSDNSSEIEFIPTNNSCTKSSNLNDNQKSPNKSLLHGNSPKLKQKVNSTLLEQFEVENPSLSKVDIIDYITKKDDVCLLQIPSNLNPNLILGHYIDIHSKTKLTLEDTKYIVKPRNEAIGSLVILGKKLRFVTPTAYLVLRKKHKDQLSENSLTKSKTEKKKNQVLEDVEPEIEVIDITDEPQKHITNENILELLESHCEKNEKITSKKRKRKGEEREDNDGNKLLNSLMEISPKKKQKPVPKILQNILLSPPSSQESNNLNENGVAKNNSNNESKLKKKKRKEDDVEDKKELLLKSIIDSINSSEKKAKPRKKQIGDNSNLTKGTKNIATPQKPSKDRKSFINSTAIPDLKSPTFSLDISKITNENIPEVSNKRKKLSLNKSDVSTKKVNRKNKTKNNGKNLSEKDILIEQIITSIKHKMESKK